MTNPVQRTVQAAQAASPYSEQPPFLYCFIRLRGGLLRTTTVKLFYTQETKMVDFIERCKSFGNVKDVDFPEEQKLGDYHEFRSALTENRIVY